MKAIQFWSALSFLAFLLLLIVGLYLIDRWTK